MSRKPNNIYEAMQTHCGENIRTFYTHQKKIVWFTVNNTQKNSIHRYFTDSGDKKNLVIFQRTGKCTVKNRRII